MSGTLLSLLATRG
jgi:hypothetical protein